MGFSKEERLAFTARAEEIVGNMTLAEKVDLMGGNIRLADILGVVGAAETEHYNFEPFLAGGNEKMGVPTMRFCDGPRGVVCNLGKSTCFPVSMLRGATFDVELEEKIGQAIGREVRGFGGNLFGGVCINLAYHPGWGRSQETYGEESFHLGQMGAALTRGVQSENVIACLKHFAFNQMEISRFKVDVDCDRRTEREVFLPHFKDAIDAGAASVMSAYNLYQAVHCGHNNYLLNRVLKNEWDFDGFVISDFIWGVKDTVEAANGGQDIEMCATEFFGEKLVKAVEDGFVPGEKIDQAATRIIRTLLAVEEAYAASGNNYDMSIAGCEEHVALALQCAREGIVLLQNNKDVLPLSKKTDTKLLVLGKLGNAENIGDHGSSQVYPPYVLTPVQGFKAVAEDCSVTYYDGSDLEEAKKLAAEADAVVFVVGYNYDDEGEYVSEDEDDQYLGATGGDRKSLKLHDDEVELILAVAPVCKKSIVSLIGGNTILMEEWKNTVDAILMAFYPGMEGARALAEIIYGDTNPSGKLPYVVPTSEADLPQVNWDTTFQHYDYYHGYTKLEKEQKTPALPYGFGLSYTTFAISDVSFSADETGITACCSVTNTGKRAGAEVVQLYVGFENSNVDRPIKQLRGFARVALEAGEKQTLHIFCPTEKICYYNPYTSQMELEHMQYETYLGTSSDTKDLTKGTVKL